MKCLARGASTDAQHVLLFGSGLIGSAIETAILKQGAWRSQRMDWTWSSPDRRADEIELLDGRTLLRHTYPIHSDNQHLGRVWHFLDITKSKNAQAQIERQRFMQNISSHRHITAC